MKFLVDECAGRRIFNWFKNAGYYVLFAKDEFGGADDDWVLKRAIQDNRIVVTCDKDFGDMVFRDLKPHNGVVLLRVMNESVENKIRIISWVMETHKKEIEGNFVLASDTSVRIVQLK